MGQVELVPNAGRAVKSSNNPIRSFIGNLLPSSCIGAIAALINS
jgi:hypothetical protein